ncbi:oligosaccharide flippase family protein [Winogradskyella sp. J14-2]|uniref:oligosaccharide flippase family protein n=1 Tax=Winogradskyella sp. J14-2 TaxID=1936080 RepID=UPI0012FA8064|nr:oligosaccharide flippase family protein [Winogradskyella sp. J14-2]
MIKYIKKHAMFGVIFTSAKALVYFVPLLLADVLTTSDFGILEYALAGLGMVTNALFNLGVPGAYPYFIIRKEQSEVKHGFSLHPIILLIPFLINQIAYFVLDLDLSFYLAFNISYIISNQVFYSTQLKSHEKSSFAVILDSGLYIVLFLLFIAYKVGLTDTDINTINTFILCYSFIYIFIAIYSFLRNKRKNLVTAYKTILRFSIHLLISTFLIFLITTSGRILVEYFFGFEEVGVYAFYFRLAAIVVMIHQVINIAFFKKIYTANPLVLDKYFSIFFVLISILSIIIYLVSPYIVRHLSDFFNNTYERFNDIYFILSAQMVMWIASALNSNIIDRENLAKKNNVFFFLLILLVLVLIYLFRYKMTFSDLIYIHFSSIYIACMIQFFSLSRKRIFFKKTGAILTLIFIFQSSYYFINF